MQFHTVIATSLLICIIGITESKYTTIVQTANGPIRGKILKTARRNIDFASFQGIPYAKSPEGELRFQPPVEMENWSEVFDAYDEGSECLQFDLQNSSLVGSENCLFLNVYAPHTNFTNINENNLKPVVVWIHGGGFILGSGTDETGPDFILEEDVIMVSINYRLGPLGFLNLNHKNATGNMGLKDQNFALKWVKKNIAKFGGDPNRVTIAGQSTGAASVDFHVLSDMSEADILPLILRINSMMKKASVTWNEPIFEVFLRSSNTTLEPASFIELSHTFTDLILVTGIDTKQKLLIQHNKHPIYYYRFSFESNLVAEIYNSNPPFHIKGARHSEDLLYLFYISPLQIQTKDPGVELTINRYVKLLTNFFKYGNPTPNGEKHDVLKVEWPTSGESGLQLEIDKELTVEPRPASERVLRYEALGIGTSSFINGCL